VNQAPTVEGASALAAYFPTGNTEKLARWIAEAPDTKCYNTKPALCDNNKRRGLEFVGGVGGNKIGVFWANQHPFR